MSHLKQLAGWVLRLQCASSALPDVPNPVQQPAAELPPSRQIPRVLRLRTQLSDALA
jgi:hypothetical protein